MFILTHSGALHSTKKIRAFTPEIFDGAAFIFCELDDSETDSIAIGKYENLDQVRSVIADIHYQMSQHKESYKMPSIEDAAMMVMGDKWAEEQRAAKEKEEKK